MVHPGAVFLYFHKPIKLENKLSASKIQLWKRHNLDILLLKEKIEGIRGVGGTAEQF